MCANGSRSNQGRVSSGQRENATGRRQRENLPVSGDCDDGNSGQFRGTDWESRSGHESWSNQLDLQVSGKADLTLLQSFVPELISSGQTETEATIRGTFQQPQVTPPPPRVDDDDDDADPPVPPAGVPQVPRGPVFNTFPAPRIATPQNPQAPSASPTPTAPVGVSTPGMAVPVPQQPGQQGVPGFPGQPGVQGFPNVGVPGIAVPNSPNRQSDRD